jgi:hypothetical protein
LNGKRGRRRGGFMVLETDNKTKSSAMAGEVKGVG